MPTTDTATLTTASLFAQRYTYLINLKTVMDINAALEGYGNLQNLMDIEVSLGTGDNSSSCTITLADPDNSVASALINHSLQSGGIPALPKPVPGATVPLSGNTTPATSTAVTSINSGAVPTARGASFTPEVLAFMNLIAQKEVPNPQDPSSYYSQNEGGANWSQYGSDGFPTDRTSGNNVGRYQFNPQDWHDFQKTDPTATKYDPVTQDRMCLWKLQYRGVLAPLLAGDLQTSILKAGHEWASLPNSVLHQTQAGYTMQDAISYYNGFLAAFKTENPNVAQATKTPLPADSAPVLPISTNNVGIVKGKKLTVTLGEYVFQYFHQGTDTDHDGKTKVTGQGVRWVMSRRQRSKAMKQLSLKQLAQQIATAHGAQLNWQADFDVNYDHIDQTGISDYQLLLRECKQSGLVLTEDNLVLTIKTLRSITDSGLTLTVGGNLLSYQISDKAMDASKEKSIDTLLQSENKVEVDPLTGTFKITKPDVDPVKDISVSGKAATAVSGKMSPVQDALAQQNRTRMKRVKGLPSSFVIPLDSDSLSLTPLAAVRTKGISNVLDRVWLVDTVTHHVADGKTELKCFSPIEVVDNTPQLVTSPTAGTTAPVATSSTGYLIPVTGVVTSLFGLRSSPGGIGSTNHKGTDIGCPEGTPVYASRDGLVIGSSFDSGGGGNVLAIKHADGWVTMYMHLSAFVARQGQTVKQMQLVAYSGNTGHSTGAHCHFQVNNPNGAAQPPSTVGFTSFSAKGNSVTAGQFP